MRRSYSISRSSYEYQLLLVGVDALEVEVGFEIDVLVFEQVAKVLGSDRLREGAESRGVT